MSNDIHIEDGKIVYKFGDQEITEYSVQEIFCRQNVRPFVIFAQSNSGKTIVGTNIVLECIKQGYSNIIYITSTYDVENNKFLRNNVLKQFVYNPDEHTDLQFMDFLMSIHDVLLSHEHQSTQTIVQKYAQPEQLTNIKISEQKYYEMLKSENPYGELLQVCFSDCHDTAEQVFQRIYRQPSLNDFFNTLEEQATALMQLFRADQHLNITYDGKEMTKMQAYTQWRNKIQTQFEQYQKQINHQYQDLIADNYNELLDTKPDQVKLFFQNPFEYKNDEYVRDICNAIQSPVKFCVIFDDVSEKLEAMSKSQKKYRDGKLKEYMSEFMKFICNKGRHYGTFYIAVHQIEALPADVRKDVGNFVITPGSVGSFTNQRSAGGTSEQKKEIQWIINALDNYNQTNGTHYMLVFFQNASESPSKYNYVFTQAEFNKRESFNKNAYQYNEYFMALLP